MVWIKDNSHRKKSFDKNAHVTSDLKDWKSQIKAVWSIFSYVCLCYTVTSDERVETKADKEISTVQAKKSQKKLSW